VLAERLARKGYRTAGISNNAWVAKHTGLARGFETFQERRDTIEGAQAQSGEHLTVQAVKRWLADAPDAKQPYFLFVNLIEPHMPYRPSFEAAAPFIAPREAFVEAVKHFFPPGKGPTFTTNRTTWARIR
jgi:hypothetical protein